MKLILFAFTILLSLVSLSQEGYLVTIKQDTLRGKINLRRDNLYDLAAVKTADGWTELKAFQVKEIKRGNDLFLPISYRNRRVFGKLVSADIIENYFVIPEGSDDFTEQILIKKDGSALLYGGIGLRKRLMNFIPECPYLVKKLDKKEIEASDFDAVVSIYKERCINFESQVSEEVVDSKELFEFAQLIIDIQQKKEAGENIPRYMIDALKQFQASSLEDQINELLLSLDN